MDQQVPELAIEMATLAQELRDELASADTARVQLAGGSPPAIIIGKVGELTRNVDPTEYEPQYVSVGPYHRISNAPLPRDDDKIRSFNAVLSAAPASSGVTPELLLNELASLEGHARSCYEHKFLMARKEFVRMMLLDGCYILSKFTDVGDDERVRGGNGGAPPVVAAAGGCMESHEAVAVVRDVLYLAENQIPFFVVEKIHQLVFSDGGVPAVARIARYVHKLLRSQHYSAASPAIVWPSAPGNLLHLLHMHFKPTVLVSPPVTPPPRTGGSATGMTAGRWRTATEYYFAGVKLKARAIGAKGPVRSIVDVRVSSGGGALEIPRLHIDGQTWRLLRNLIALEQRNPEAAGRHVTAYCVFASQLAGTARDVELLARRGVVVHGLGNHGEVAGWFAGLCKGALFDADDPECNYLRPVWQALERRFRSRPWRWVALLRQKYLGNPWLVLGLVAGHVVLACTVVQAVYAVLSYKH